MPDILNVRDEAAGTVSDGLTVGDLEPGTMYDVINTVGDEGAVILTVFICRRLRT
jgi:hypothetical protein